jgi:hypothetical protein
VRPTGSSDGDVGCCSDVVTGGPSRSGAPGCAASGVVRLSVSVPDLPANHARHVQERPNKNVAHDRRRGGHARGPVLGSHRARVLDISSRETSITKWPCYAISRIVVAGAEKRHPEYVTRESLAAISGRAPDAAEIATRARARSGRLLDRVAGLLHALVKGPRSAHPRDRRTRHRQHHERLTRQRHPHRCHFHCLPSANLPVSRTRAEFAANTNGRGLGRTPTDMNNLRCLFRPS